MVAKVGLIVILSTFRADSLRSPALARYQPEEGSLEKLSPGKGFVPSGASSGPVKVKLGMVPAVFVLQTSTPFGATIRPSVWKYDREVPDESCLSITNGLAMFD
jgi:hypothetical protein